MIACDCYISFDLYILDNLFYSSFIWRQCTVFYKKSQPPKAVYRNRASVICDCKRGILHVHGQSPNVVAGDTVHERKLFFDNKYVVFIHYTDETT